MHSFKSIIVLFVLTTLGLQAQQLELQHERTLGHVKYLSSEELAGRYPGTTGDIKAANFIRDKFKESGLKLLYNKGFQSFEVITGVSLAAGNTLEIEDFETIIEKDYVPLSFSANGSANGTVVFAGYGIVFPGRWDDYAGIDAQGKWVLVLAGDPEPNNPQSDFIPYASDRMKAITAADKGAVGMLLVKGPSMEAEDNLMPAYYDKNASDAGILVISITRRVADYLITGRGFTIATLEKELQSSMQPFSFKTHNAVGATVSLTHNKVSTQNIVAMLSGTDPEFNNEFIVIGAHYDHLGMGGTGSGSRTPDNLAIHHGADDNASGVAGLIELAAAFSNKNIVPKRNIIFIAFGAEEMGLIGSKYFVDNLPMADANIKAMINLDMIGRLTDDPVLNVGGTGTARQFDDILNKLEQDRVFTLNRQPDGYGPSDHAAFYAASIPVLFITTGPHEDYHTPEDTWDKVNHTGMVKIKDFVFDVASYLADMDESLTFTESGIMARRGHGRGYKVTLGIIPDVSSSKNGLGVDGVRQGGPAAMAGIRKGDMIIGMNGLPVGNIYEYMARLKTLSPGETVIVEVLRNGRKEVLLVQL